jgi:hypothetical protein
MFKVNAPCQYVHLLKFHHHWYYLSLYIKEICTEYMHIMTIYVRLWHTQANTLQTTQNKKKPDRKWVELRC